jgi:ribosome-binding factor A
MKFKKIRRRQDLSSCDEIGPDDGADPRTFFRERTYKRTNRKALQLCGQIARTLSSVLTYESSDDLLRCRWVESVEPSPDSTRVLVTVSVGIPSEGADPNEVLAHLYRSAGKMRTEIAAAIHRKRVPELVFRVIPRGEVDS